MTSMASSADYDAQRRPVIDIDDDGVDDLKASLTSSRSSTADANEADAGEGVSLSGADQNDEELTATVVPMMADEFRCSRCFLVHHRSQLAKRQHGQDICRECA
jgi:hypothetical protein